MKYLFIKHKEYLIGHLKLYVCIRSAAHTLVYHNLNRIYSKWNKHLKNNTSIPALEIPDETFQRLQPGLSLL